MVIPTTTTTTITTMTERRADASLIRLAAWLSPAFPVGSFSYSHGLERAVHDGLVRDAGDLADWIASLLTAGSGWTDAVLLADSWRRAAAGETPTEIAELAEALAGSAERHLESTAQGVAFLAATQAWPDDVTKILPANCPYCVAVGAVAGAHGAPLGQTVALFLQAFATNLVQSAIRLGVLGQTQAVELVAGLEPVLLDTAARAASSTLDDLGSATVLADIAAMNHETQHSRLFRS